jgi:hypothetical protein
VTFFIAYVQPDKAVLISINTFGEAHLEAVAIPIIFAVSMIGCYYTFKDILRRKM